MEAASVHLTDITVDAQVHDHKAMTEIYVILEGEGHMELDGALVPVKPMTSIFIKPGCRHRAVGRLRILNIPIPAFDPQDEWFESLHLVVASDELRTPTRFGRPVSRRRRRVIAVEHSPHHEKGPWRQRQAPVQL